jgi:hypothetical protein
MPQNYEPQLVTVDALQNIDGLHLLRAKRARAMVLQPMAMKLLRRPASIEPTNQMESLHSLDAFTFQSSFISMMEVSPRNIDAYAELEE